MDHESALPGGFRFDEYEIVRVLGAGGFGITYLGYDHHLDKPVAIKEYLPNDLAVRKGDTSVVAKSSGDQSDFDWGLERFLEEARVLARFDHPNLPKVYRYFQAHGTGYIVMEYAEGKTLSEMLKKQGKLKEEALKRIMLPLLDGLEKVHQAGYLHRDIKPANIVIRDDGSPVLIDFGAARAALGVKSRSVTSIVTPGYAPIEQYSSRAEQGVWTDLYAMAAVMYKAVTGKTPEDATDRMRDDPLQPAAEAGKGQASQAFLQAINWGLAVDEGARPQAIEAWRESMTATGRVAQTPPASQPGTSAIQSVSTGEEDSVAAAPRMRVTTKLDRRLTAGTTVLGLLVLVGVVLYLTDTQDRVPDTQDQAADMARLYVDATPDSADVQVQETGRATKTPYTRGMRIREERQYTITASAAGYETATRKRYVASTDNSIRINLNLERKSADSDDDAGEQDAADQAHGAWQQATETDTPQAYRNFISDYPDSRYVTLANVKLQILERDLWAEANERNTQDVYQEFMETFPDSRFSRLAEMRAERL